MGKEPHLREEFSWRSPQRERGDANSQLEGTRGELRRSAAEGWGYGCDLQGCSCQAGVGLGQAAFTASSACWQGCGEGIHRREYRLGGEGPKQETGVVVDAGDVWLLYEVDVLHETERNEQRMAWFIEVLGDLISVQIELNQFMLESRLATLRTPIGHSKCQLWLQSLEKRKT